jgi:Ca2+-dependent lipid-binding protein
LNKLSNSLINFQPFSYGGDCDITFSVKGVKAGIKDFQVSGLVRVVMKPLLTQMPMIGGLQVFFLNNPEIDFNLVGIADVLDFPGLRLE